MSDMVSVADDGLNETRTDAEQSYVLILVAPLKDNIEIGVYGSYLPPIGAIIDHTTGEYRVISHRLGLYESGIDWTVQTILEGQRR